MPSVKTGKKVAVVGSGPAGLAAAQQLTRAGHDVVVFERADRIGGLLRYGIPEFKMEKRHLDRRLDQMRAEGTEFRTGVDVGVDVTADELRAEFDAIVLAGGATVRRDLPIPGRELDGIHQAMEYLPLRQPGAGGRPRRTRRSPPRARTSSSSAAATPAPTASAPRTARAPRSSTSSRSCPARPRTGPTANPWPTYPMIFRIASAHEEGGERVYAVNTVAFLGDDDGNLVRAHAPTRSRRCSSTAARPSRRSRAATSSSPATSCFLAMGFTGAEQRGPARAARRRARRPGQRRPRRRLGQHGADGVFVAGDMGRGQSLIVWAIAEGRSCAAAVDRHLMGDTDLPAPITPDAVSLR